MCAKEAKNAVIEHIKSIVTSNDPEEIKMELLNEITNELFNSIENVIGGS